MPPIASALRETTSLGFGAKDQPEVNDHRNIHVRPAANGRAWPHREEENRSLDYRESVRIYAFVLVKDDPLYLTASSSTNPSVKRTIESREGKTGRNFRYDVRLMKTEVIQLLSMPTQPRVRFC